MRYIHFLATFLAFLGMQGCGMAPIKREIPLPSQELDAPVAGPGFVRMVVFNSSGGIMHGIDRTGHINLSLDGKGAGYVPMGSYLILEVPPGAHRMELAHRDLWLMRSEHEIEVKAPRAFLRIFSTAVSNDFEYVKELPPDFGSDYEKAVAE